MLNRGGLYAVCTLIDLLHDKFHFNSVQFYAELVSILTQLLS